MQQAEQGVQQVPDDGAELFGGRVVDQLLWLIGLGRPGASGSQRHPQPLNCMVSQVKLQLQLDAVLIGRKHSGVLLYGLIRLAQEILSVVGAVQGGQVNVLKERFQAMTGQVVPVQRTNKGKTRRWLLSKAPTIREWMNIANDIL